jgi:hypothetical protein
VSWIEDRKRKTPLLVQMEKLLIVSLNVHKLDNENLNLDKVAIETLR